MSQKIDILAWLGTYGTITAREASRGLNCDRLAARVHELREDGHPIQKIMVYDRKPDGTPEKYARYFMGKKEDANNDTV